MNTPETTPTSIPTNSATAPLRSTLDSETQAALDRQRILAMKENLSPEDETELRELKAKLSPLGFNQTIRDPLYELFVKAWTERENPAWTQAVQLRG